MPSNGNDLEPEQAVDVARLKAVKKGLLKPGQILHIFIGVDEYQNINNEKGIKIGIHEMLQDFIDCLGKTLGSVLNGIRIYPMMVGTDFSAGSIQNSSSTQCERHCYY